MLILIGGDWRLLAERADGAGIDRKVFKSPVQSQLFIRDSETCRHNMESSLKLRPVSKCRGVLFSLNIRLFIAAFLRFMRSSLVRVSRRRSSSRSVCPSVGSLDGDRDVSCG